MNTEEQGTNGQQQATTGVPSAPDVPDERGKFRALILANPNYFGNVKDSPFPAVLNIQLNRFYEEIGCVGFQPQFNRLDAVVYVNQPSGYGGGVCTAGTQEYVRFYISGDNGATWQDVGLTSFTAWDIPAGTTGTRRLEYAVALQIDPRKRFCFVENQYLVRAILSWNVPPPPNTPNFIPVWGSVHNTHIQIDPLKLILVAELLEQAQIKLPPQIARVLDLSQPIPVAQPKTLSALELKQMYKGKVEPHRFALAELQQLISKPALSENLMAPGFGGLLGQLEIGVEDLIDQLFPTDGSTVYEELECIGLNPSQDALVGVIRVKLPSGYSGGPCTAGSREYVAFWGDFDNNGSYETYLGTTSVNVHDITPFPREGLEYSVFLPVDLDQYRRPCQRGARVVRIRAILSWQVAPPPANPNYIPVWGNREHTLIHIKPGAVRTGHTPIIETVGSMAVANINGFGYANGPAILLGFTAIDSPFGGEVILTGHLANPADISGGATALKYKVIVNDGSGPQALTNPFTIGRSQLLDGVWTFPPNVSQMVDGDDFYLYQEDLTGGPGNAQIFVLGNILARWQTAGKTGTWKIQIVAKDAAGVLYPSDPVTVRLDNEEPRIPAGSFRITSGGGSCADFVVGDIIEGVYHVTDEHFNRLSFSVLPPLGGTFTEPVPLPAYPMVTGPDVSGVWKLNTAGMPKCGYVVRLGVSDRTIVNSAVVGFSNEAFVGLCLKLPGTAGVVDPVCTAGPGDASPGAPAAG